MNHLSALNQSSSLFDQDWEVCMWFKRCSGNSAPNSFRIKDWSMTNVFERCFWADESHMGIRCPSTIQVTFETAKLKFDSQFCFYGLRNLLILDWSYFDSKSECKLHVTDLGVSFCKIDRSSESHRSNLFDHILPSQLPSSDSSWSSRISSDLPRALNNFCLIMSACSCLYIFA